MSMNSLSRSVNSTLNSFPRKIHQDDLRGFRGYKYDSEGTRKLHDAGGTESPLFISNADLSGYHYHWPKFG